MKMITCCRAALLAAVFAVIGAGPSLVRAQGEDWRRDGDDHHDVLHIQHTATTAQTGFPQYLYMYHVLDGANSRGEVRGLTGEISLTNHAAEFSEVLWVLAYWKGDCPADDQSLAGANVIWTEIQKNPTRSADTLAVNLHFPNRLPMTGCLGFIFAGGPLVQGAGAVTMSASLDLEYRASDSPPNAVVDFSGEYCFGQNWGCQNATVNDTQGFAVPITMTASGQLVELYGDISDSTFDGTANFGPLPTNEVWGATNNFYLLPGGCGKFAGNLDGQGFPNPVSLSTLNGWIPGNVIHLESVPMDYQIPPNADSRASLTRQIETLLPYPVKVNAGDCVVVVYGRKGDGASDNETQIHAVLVP